MFSTFLIHVTHITAFMFAAEANVNGGIISTIFSSICVFNSIIFYFKYGQKISKSDIIGTILILACVTLISLPPKKVSFEHGSAEDYDLNQLFLALALVMALAAGLTLSFNTVNIYYVIGTGFDLDQANYDGISLLGLLYFPLCLYFRKEFGWEIYVIATVAVTFGTMGVISISRAMKYGNAGPA